MIGLVTDPYLRLVCVCKADSSLIGAVAHPGGRGKRWWR